MNSRNTICAVALGATLLVGGEAFAKGGTPKRQTMQLTRSSSDADATGTVTVTHGKNGDQTIITLSHLNPRTTYEVRDSSTGAVLGSVKTNRRGRATFDLTKNVQKAASNGGSSDGTTTDPTGVDVVDTSTDTTVLTGTVTPPAAVPAEGFADVTDDAGDEAMIDMATDPTVPDDSFSLTFYPANDPNADPTSGTSFYYDMNLDTGNGDALPLGVASVSDLAGRDFEIHGADGSVVLSGTLPTLTPDDSSDDDGSSYGNGSGGDMNGGCPGMGGDFGGGFGALDSLFGGGIGARHGQKSAVRHGHQKDAGANPFTLFIADANGVLQSAGALTQETDDGSNGFSGDPFGGFDPNSQGGFMMVFFFMPMDGMGNFFDQFMNGGFSGNLGDLFGGSGSSGSSGSSSDPTNGGSTSKHGAR